MIAQASRDCRCDDCQDDAGNATKAIHTLMNHFLATLEPDAQRLYLGVEALKRGPGSERLLSLITGWTEQSIIAARDAAQQLVRDPAADERDGEGNEPPPEKRVLTLTSRSYKLVQSGRPRPAASPPVFAK